MFKISFVACAVFVISMQNVCAAPLLYHGNNPNITPSASAFNATAIDARAALTRPKEKTVSAAGQSDAELVRRSVLSQISSTITQKLVGSGQDSGIANFGDGSYAEWSTVDGIRTIITHNLDGTSTTISFPL
jgi:hypothetical protein